MNCYHPAGAETRIFQDNFSIPWQLICGPLHRQVINNHFDEYSRWTNALLPRGSISMICVIPIWEIHYNEGIMSEMASQITSVSIVYSTLCSIANHRKHQCSASLTFVRGTHRSPVNSPHKGPVTRKMTLALRPWVRCCKMPLGDEMTQITRHRNILYTFMQDNPVIIRSIIKSLYTKHETRQI